MKPFRILKYILLIVFTGPVNFQSFAQEFVPGKTFDQVIGEARKNLDSLINNSNDSNIYNEGGIKSRYENFCKQWAPRVAPSGNLETYFNELENYYTNSAARLQSAIPNPVFSSDWEDLGPNTMSGSSLIGIGPIRFIKIYKGDYTIPDPTNSRYMLCGSTTGGLFLSDNYGDNWHSAFNENGAPLHGWHRAGVFWAEFSETDPNIIFASTSGQAKNIPGVIGKVDGIYRSMDFGQNWDLIANFVDFANHPYTAINKTISHPTNPNLLIACTNIGIFKTTTALDADPVWEKVFPVTPPGWNNVMDVEYKIDNPETLIATAEMGSGNWQAIRSDNFGATWSPIGELASQFPNATLLTVETVNTAAGYNYFYFLKRESLLANATVFSQITKFDINTSTILNTSNLSINYGSGFSRGQAFAVNTNNLNECFINFGTAMKKVNISTNATIITASMNHSDIEHIIFDPNDPNKVWVANHGGISLTNQTLSSPMYKNNGLGIAEVLHMAASNSTNNVLSAGLNHDGSILTSTVLSSPWNPSWTYLYDGDGENTLIDNSNDANIWLSNNYTWGFSNDQGATPLSTLPSVSAAGSVHSWDAPGVLNKEFPNYFYRVAEENIGSFYDYDEVWRSSAQPYTSYQKISNFNAHFSPLSPPTGGIHQLFTPYGQNNGNYLYAIVRDDVDPDIVWKKNWHLYVNKDVNNTDPTVVINAWHELSWPLADFQWPTDIEIDKTDPDIIYLSAEPVENINSPKMVFKLNYNNDPIYTRGTCPSGSCEDLTLNLPEMRTGDNCLAVDQFRHEGIYLMTDVGMFYSNSVMRGNGTGWVKFGDLLPHVDAGGVEINYLANKIRVGLVGRGFWQHDLVCPLTDDITDNTIYNSNNSNYFVEAVNTIISTSEVQSTGNVTFSAGTRITLQPGFKAREGSFFHAQIQACDEPGGNNRVQNQISSMIYNSSEKKGKTTEKDEKEKEENEVLIFAYPNPTKDKVYIEVKNNFDDGFKVLLFDAQGKKVFESFLPNPNSIIDISKFNSGIYQLIINRDFYPIYQQKIIKQ